MSLLLSLSLPPVTTSIRLDHKIEIIVSGVWIRMMTTNDLKKPGDAAVLQCRIQSYSKDLEFQLIAYTVNL
jgi:hypothetical protein